MTPKIKCKATRRGYYQCFPVVDEQGNKYSPIRNFQGYKAGDVVFLGKRINNHHGQLAEWEIWPYKLELDHNYCNMKWTSLKTWFRDGRYLFEKVS
jgi:hypothetical protein